MKKQISTSEFRQRREEGATVGELAAHYGISQANVKEIISKLNLPKRAKRVGYTLVEESQNTTAVSEQTQVEQETIN